MFSDRCLAACALLLTFAGSTPSPAALEVMTDAAGTTIPLEWIDADTGHRVRRLSRGPGDYRSFYFHNRPFFESAAGDDLMVFNGSAPDATSAAEDAAGARRGVRANALYTVNLRTGEVLRVARNARSEIVGAGSGRAYFQPRGERAVCAVNLLSGEISKLAALPEGEPRVNLSALNRDETLLAGTIVDEPWPEGLDCGNSQGGRVRQIFDAKQARRLVVFDLRSGELRTLLRERNWFNHLQFSPVDPQLLMFCHEGPWHLLDRIWTICVDGGATAGRRMLERSVEREIAGHEWWDPSGGIIWCDHQIPRGETFFVTGIELQSLRRTSYRLERNEWSVHFTLAPDGKFFAGDGGSPGMVAKAPDGRWIYLFRPNREKMCFEAEKLVNMRDHDYALEPNVRFTPDAQWIVFRSNMHGPAHVYAVEVARSAIPQDAAIPVP